MKKGIIALSILCTGLLLFDPIKNISFANKSDNLVNKVEKYETNTYDKELYNENSTVSENENIDKEDKYKDNKVEEEKSEYTNQESEIKQEVVVNENKETTKDECEDNISKEEKQVLSKEEAEQLLISINPELEYLYQGDENSFPVLKEKDLTGYVFLPNVDGDIGYFVDKTNSDVYFFHPSGYLELVK